jgi:putative membrane protein
VILAEWAPLLAVFAIAPAMAAAASRVAIWRVLTHPALALPLWLGDYDAWHVPAVYDAALRHQNSLIHVEHACYFGTGFLFW